MPVAPSCCILHQERKDRQVLGGTNTSHFRNPLLSFTGDTEH